MLLQVVVKWVSLEIELFTSLGSPSTGHKRSRTLSANVSLGLVENMDTLNLAVASDDQSFQSLIPSVLRRSSFKSGESKESVSNSSSKSLVDTVLGLNVFSLSSRTTDSTKDILNSTNASENEKSIPDSLLLGADESEADLKDQT